MADRPVHRTVPIIPRIKKKQYFADEDGGGHSRDYLKNEKKSFLKKRQVQRKSYTDNSSNDFSFNHILPKGSILYHGSTNRRMFQFGIDKILFFGLDPEIAIWYIHERQFLDKSKQPFGYLFQFETTEDIPVVTVDWHTDGFEHIKMCTDNPKVVCLSSQLTLRKDTVYGSENPYLAIHPLLYTELTLNYNYYKNKLNLLSTSLIDLEMLDQYERPRAYNSDGEETEEEEMDPFKSIITTFQNNFGSKRKTRRRTSRNKRFSRHQLHYHRSMNSISTRRNNF